MSKKTLDQEIDELFDILPSDEEIKKETTYLRISQARVGQESNHKGKSRPWKGKSRENKSVEHHTEESKKKISITKKEKYALLNIDKPPKPKKIRSKFRTEETKKKIAKTIIDLQGIKCIVIDPNGTRYEFNTIKECESKLNYKNLTPNAVNIFPIDGSLKVGKRGRWKGWTFFRII